MAFLLQSTNSANRLRLAVPELTRPAWEMAYEITSCGEAHRLLPTEAANSPSKE
jgi:hypothetical protein